MEWIEISKDQPNEFHTVLLYYGDLDISTGYYVGWRDEWVPHNRLCIGMPTHWQELPDPPHQPKLTWQAKAKNSDEWLDISDETYEQTQHLSRFEFRRIEK